MNIKKEELLSKYGINLEKGSYTIENLGDKYKINTLQDDTSGCILVGDQITEKGLLYSTTAYQRLYVLLENALKKGKVYIRIEDIPKPVEVIPVVPKPVVVEEPKPIILPTIEVKPSTPVIKKQNWIIKLINIIKQWINN